MKQSQLFTKTQKDAPKDEVSVNAQLLIRAGFVDKLMAGVYTFLPLGLRVMKKIENIIREEINAIGGQEIFMPTLQPKENWLKTGRWDTMDDLYKVKDASGKEFALGPTHEEIVVPLAQKYINSYRDFPFYAYQFQNKFRMELRAKSGILRGREFMMKDLYSFHLSEDDFNAYYEKAAKAYEKIFQRTGIGEKTYKTFASGGSFSKYSHEYQTVTPAGEDLIHICNQCGLAINEEIKGEVDVCPSCKGADFRKEKAIEVGNIFNLKNKYTQPFDFKIKDEKGEEKEVIMGCYGLGLSRLMGTIVEVFHDDKGIIWPESVAPFKVHLISLGKNDEAEKIYNDLIKKSVEVLFDDREETAGKKFADSDLIGIPYRIVVSEKSLQSGGVEIKKRNQKETEIINQNSIIEKLNA
ncbi:MAG: aminoacyl--tRNA ligase-related protein [Parcubacteria group bacterium]|jgi:prolyl-tRNA synthetase